MLKYTDKELLVGTDNGLYLFDQNTNTFQRADNPADPRSLSAVSYTHLDVYKRQAFMNIQVINKSKHPLPAYATELSAGMDIRANLSEPITLEPLQRCLVPTGLYLSLIHI